MEVLFRKLKEPILQAWASSNFPETWRPLSSLTYKPLEYNKSICFMMSKDIVRNIHDAPVGKQADA